MHCKCRDMNKCVQHSPHLPIYSRRIDILPLRIYSFFSFFTLFFSFSCIRCLTSCVCRNQYLVATTPQVSLSFFYFHFVWISKIFFYIDIAYTYIKANSTASMLDRRILYIFQLQTQLKTEVSTSSTFHKRLFRSFVFHAFETRHIMYESMSMH